MSCFKVTIFNVLIHCIFPYNKFTLLSGAFHCLESTFQCYWLAGLSQFPWNSFSHHFQSTYSSLYPPVACTPGSGTGGKAKKESEENLRKWNLIIKEYTLKLNMDMTVTTKTLSNQHLPIVLHDTMVK